MKGLNEIVKDNSKTPKEALSNFKYHAAKVSTAKKVKAVATGIHTQNKKVVRKGL